MFDAKHPRRNVRRIVALYAVGAAAWILASDLLLALALGEPPAWTLGQTVKGLAFVATTTLLLYLLLRRWMNRLRKATLDRAVFERERRESEERFRQLAESVREVFWLSDVEKARILYVNPAYEEIWGRSVESLIEEPGSWLDAIHPDDRKRVERALPLQRSGQYDEEYRIVRPDGEVRWIHDRSFPVENERGTPDRVAGVAEDVTDRKRAEEALLKKERQLQQAQKMDALGRLASGVAHDFNNALTVISGYTSLLRDELESDSPHLESLGEIERAAEHASALVHRLLMFARPSEGEPRPLVLDEAIQDLHGMLRRVLPSSIALELRPRTPGEAVRIDRGQLEQVVVNLAVNARDAIDGNGTVTVETEHRTVDGGVPDLPSGDYLLLAVRDTGAGMPEEMRSKVLEPFFSTKGSEGTGLGLSIVYGIVQAAGGIVQIDSEPGQGTSVEVLLPCDGAAA